MGILELLLLLLIIGAVFGRGRFGLGSALDIVIALLVVVLLYRVVVAIL
jgi:ABC-type sugar transport system permease subunit